MTSHDKCKVAIIGAGGMAREHIRAFSGLPNVRVAGIHSRTRVKAEVLAKEFHISTVCGSLSELYERTHADLVVLAVSVDMNYDRSKKRWEG